MRRLSIAIAAWAAIVTGPVAAQVVNTGPGAVANGQPAGTPTGPAWVFGTSSFRTAGADLYRMVASDANRLTEVSDLYLTPQPAGWRVVFTNFGLDANSRAAGTPRELRPGNGNTLTFPKVMADRAGTYALTLRYSNEEQAKATHYNPDPLARIARISVNGGKPMLASAPHSFNANNWWEMTVPVTLKAGANTIRIAGEEQPNWDGRTYASQRWPGILLRSRYAPNIDRITITPMP